MSSSQINAATGTVLTEKDTNMPTATGQAGVGGEGGGDVKSMEYHRQVLASKMAAGQGKESDNYVSPSDGIMSPASAKLTAYKNKQFGKGKPQSLFAKNASKNIAAKGGPLFGDVKAATSSPSTTSTTPESN